MFSNLQQQSLCGLPDFLSSLLWPTSISACFSTSEPISESSCDTCVLERLAPSCKAVNSQANAALIESDCLETSAAGDICRP